MAGVTLPAVTVRARIHLQDPRWADAMTEAVAGGDAWARSRWPVLLGDGGGVRGLAERKRRPLEPGLARWMAERNAALGGSDATRANCRRLALGEAVAAVGGQQPAPLGGPLYALHKCATAVALARRIEERHGVPCVPVFWVASEDSDFAEIRTATVADARLVTHELSLGAEHHPEGGLVGAIPSSALEPIAAAAGRVWAELGGAVQAVGLFERSARRGRDLGEAYAALLLELFADQGLVVVDPRWPALRAAARPIYERYLRQAGELARAANAAGEDLERRFGRRPLTPAALESWLFAVSDGRRHKVSAEEAPAHLAHDALSPSVALRPIVQDALLNVVAIAVGSGELAYLAQLGEAYRLLGVEPAVPVPRFGATWLPPAARELLAATGADAWELVTAADAVVRQLAESRVPPGVLEEARAMRRRTFEALERFAPEAARVDASLPQVVGSARGKVDFQMGRIEEAVLHKARLRLERERPEYVRLRYYLLPGDRLQERRLASLEPVAYRGPRAAVEMVEAATEHLRALEAGRLTHALVEL
jgi:uncharacterized protein YllA (UPF0747 family)